VVAAAPLLPPPCGEGRPPKAVGVGVNPAATIPCCPHSKSERAVRHRARPLKSTNPISTKCTDRSRCPTAPTAHPRANLRKTTSAAAAKSSSPPTPANPAPNSAPPRAPPAARRGNAAGGSGGECSCVTALTPLCFYSCSKAQPLLRFTL
jgi:hypothetical protein